MALIVALGVACALGLAFPDTRWLGVVAAALLGAAFPPSLFVILPLAGVLLFFLSRS